MGSKLPAELFLHFGRQGMADDDNRTTASASREADVRHRLRVRRNEVPRAKTCSGGSQLPAEFLLHFGRQGMADDDNMTN